MSRELLYGRTLVWVSFDPACVFTSGLRSILAAELEENCRIDLVLASSVDQAAQLVEQNRAGLLSLVCSGQDDQAAVFRTLRRVQLRRSDCLRCVYWPQNVALDELAMREAGAQIAVHQIPWMQQHVTKWLPRIPRRAGGNHPLTAGLIDRLPWTDEV